MAVAAGPPARPAPTPLGRQEMKRRIFSVLDSDSDGRLGCADMRRFAELIGFDSDAAAWREEFEALCAGRGNTTDEGLGEADFLAMVDDDESDSGLFCSDKYLTKAHAQLTQPVEHEVFHPKLMAMAALALQLRAMAAEAEEKVEAESSEIAAILRAKATLANQDVATNDGAIPSTGSNAKANGQGRAFYKQMLREAQNEVQKASADETDSASDSDSDLEEDKKAAEKKEAAGNLDPTDEEESSDDDSEESDEGGGVDEMEEADAVAKAAQIRDRVRCEAGEQPQQGHGVKRRRRDEKMAGQGTLQDELLQLADVQKMRDKTSIPRLAKKIAHVFLPVDGNRGVLHAMGDVVTRSKVPRPLKMAVIYVLHELLLSMKPDQREAFARDSVHQVLSPVGPYVARLSPEHQASWFKMLDVWSIKNLLQDRHLVKLRRAWKGERD